MAQILCAALGFALRLETKDAPGEVNLIAYIKYVYIYIYTLYAVNIVLYCIPLVSDMWYNNSYNLQLCHLI